MKATRPCPEDGCDRPIKCGGLCTLHYQRKRRLGTTVLKEKPTGCTVDGCDREHCSGGLCEMHYRRNLKYGDVTAVYRRGGRRDDPSGYAASQVRVKKSRGRASTHPCDVCGRSAQDWAYLHTDPNELTETVPDRNKPGETRTVPFSADPKFYAPMCKSCHVTFDKAVARGEVRSRVAAEAVG